MFFMKYHNKNWSNKKINQWKLRTLFVGQWYISVVLFAWNGAEIKYVIFENKRSDKSHKTK